MAEQGQTIAFQLHVEGSTQTVKTFQTLTKLIAENRVEMTKLKKAGLETSDAYGKLVKTEIALKQETTATRKELVLQQKAFKELNDKIPKDSLVGLSRTLNAQIKEWEKLSAAQRKSPMGKELSQKIQKTDAEVKKLNAEVGRFQRNVGNYPQTFMKFGQAALGAFGVGSALYVGVGLFRDGARTVKEFNKAQVELQSLSGQTADQLQGLTDEAKRLGRETLFTATEVTKLQVELSKLGFTNNEISQVTGDIINFAIALDAQVAPAATVAASTMRAFGLDATEMGRIVSVLGVAANKTALSFEDFEGNIATFAPVARQFGFSIEDSITLFGKLRDAGFDASTAATALRNIFLKLADPNGDLAKRLGAPIKKLDDLVPALKRLKDEGIDLGEAFELTGERSVAAFGQLVEESASLTTLRDSLTDVNEEFEEMVEKRMKSLDAQIKLTKSAWDGFILSVDEGDGVISESVVGVVTAFRQLLGVITDVNEGIVSMGAVTEDLNSIILAIGTLGGSLFFEGSSAVREEQENARATERGVKASVERIVKILKEGSEEEKKIASERIKELEAKAKSGDKLAQQYIKQFNLLSEGVQKVVGDGKGGGGGTTDKIFKFAEGTIGFLTEKISELNKVLQNTTPETVITQTTLQIVELQRIVDELQLKIDSARIKAERGVTAPAAQRIGTLGLPAELAPLKPGESLESQAEIDILKTNEQLKQDIKNQYREEDLAAQEAHNQFSIDLTNDLFNSLANNFEGFFSAEAEDRKEAFKSLILDLLSYVERVVQLSVVEALAKQIAGKGFAGIATGAVLGGIIKLAFAGIKAAVTSGFEEGGVIKDGIPFQRSGSNDNVLIHARKRELVLTEKNQTRARQLFGEGVFGDIGVKGFNNAPMNNIIRMQNNNDIGNVNLSEGDMRRFGRVVSTAIKDRDRELERRQLQER